MAQVMVSCSLAGSADQDHLVLEMGADLVPVFAQQVQRHVVGAGDVHRLELGGSAHVEDARRGPSGEQAVQPGRVH